MPRKRRGYTRLPGTGFSMDENCGRMTDPEAECNQRVPDDEMLTTFACRHPEPLTAEDIARVFSVDTTTVQTQLETLADDGKIERKDGVNGRIDWVTDDESPAATDFDVKSLEPGDMFRHSCVSGANQGWNVIVDREEVGGKAACDALKIRNCESGERWENDEWSYELENPPWTDDYELIPILDIFAPRDDYEIMEVLNCNCTDNYTYHDKWETWVCPMCDL